MRPCQGPTVAVWGEGWWASWGGSWHRSASSGCLGGTAKSKPTLATPKRQQGAPSQQPPTACSQPSTPAPACDAANSVTAARAIPDSKGHVGALLWTLPLSAHFKV